MALSTTHKKRMEEMALRDLSEADWLGVERFIHARAGIVMRDNRLLAASRIHRQMANLGIQSVARYLSYVEQHQDEAQVLVDLLTTHETYFFREKKHFTTLGKSLKRWPYETKVRVWSAACSTGEEPYSVAMTLYDKLGLAREWSVTGTDVSVPALEKARRAIYSMRRLHNMDKKLLKLHCQRGQGNFEGSMRLKRHITERVDFSPINLHQSCTHLGEFHAIFLRNVLIYFTPEDQQQIIRRVCMQLVKGGLFFLGKSELVQNDDLPLRLVGQSTWEKT